MKSLQSRVSSLWHVSHKKIQDFVSEIENVHMVWLEEIQQEANSMFSSDFNAAPELMPKTPSQKKNSRRKRVSVGRQEQGQPRRRFSKGKRSNLRGSAVKFPDLVPEAAEEEEEAVPDASVSKPNTRTQPKRTTRRNKQTRAEDAEESSGDGVKQEEAQNKKPALVEEVEEIQKVNDAETEPEESGSTSQSPPKMASPELVVRISAEDRLSAELAIKPAPSPGRTATKMAIAGAARSSRHSSRRSSARCSLKLRQSLAGLRHSMTQESVRRSSRRSMLKRKSIQMGYSNSSSSNVGGTDSSMDAVNEDDGEDKIEGLAADTGVDEPEKEKEAPEKPETDSPVSAPAVERVTRSVAANSPKLAPPPLFSSEAKISTPVMPVAAKRLTKAAQRSSLSKKRKGPEIVESSPSKQFSPPKKSQSAVRPNMRSFLHTVHKNQMLMMTPNSLGRTAVVKSFIKHTTPLKMDPRAKERNRLEALKKKQEQEEERMKKMEEEKKRKLEELKRKREERMRKVVEAKVKEEQKEEEKKKKIEQKMVKIEEKNDKRQAEEKAKKRMVGKRQEELEQKKKLEEEAKKKKIQQEEEKRQQELAAKKKAEEEELQARKALEREREREKEREREREKERERERERQAAAAAAAAERERLEKEKALRREVERAAREKEMKQLEEKRKALEAKRKLEEQQMLAANEKILKEREEAKQREAAAAAAAAAAAKTQHSTDMLNKTVDIERSVMQTPVGKGALNVTVDIQESSPQTYAITPSGGNKPLVLSKNPDDYGMDQNSDDSTDDESAPRKPIPSWAQGALLKQLIAKQYFNPPNLDSFFGPIEPPRLENIFYKSKPRYFKRTSSAVWHSPPAGAK